MTLTEVLISMGILAIGLFGRCGHVSRRRLLHAKRRDRPTAAPPLHKAAFADLVARGDLSPENWQVWSGATSDSMGNAMRTWMAGENRTSTATYQKNMNNAMGFVYVIDPPRNRGGQRGRIETGARH